MEEKKKETKGFLEFVILLAGCVLGFGIGGLLLLFGLGSLGSGLEGIGDLERYTGKLKIVTPATDKALGLTDMGPVIFRTAEMYQYVPEMIKVHRGKYSCSENLAKKGFSSEANEKLEAYATEADAEKGSEYKKTYHNPKFPKAFLSENKNGRSVIYGEVEIGDTGIKIDSELLVKYFDWDFKYRVPAYKDPEDAGSKYHLLHTGKGKYATRKDKNWKLGDLKVTYKVVDPKILEEEFTAIGKLSKDKTLKLKEARGALYRGNLSMKEANKKYRNDRFIPGIIFCLIGGGLICIGILSVKNLIS